MIQRIRKEWKVILPIATIFLAAIIYLDDLIGAKKRLTNEFKKTALYDYFRNAPEYGQARILVADVRYDDNGRYTAEIREMLRREGKHYRMLGREYGEEDEQGNWKDLATLLARHKAVLLLEGAVSADMKSIRIRIRNRNGRIDRRRNIELNRRNLWTDELSKLVVLGTQELVDNVRVDLLTIEKYEELAATVRDALTQSKTENDKLQAQFQLAYIQGDIAFLKGDMTAILKVLESYKELLKKYEGKFQEGPIRINMGVTYQNLGRMTGNKKFTRKAEKEYGKAEEIFEQHENVEKTLKAMTVRYSIERNRWFENAMMHGNRDVIRLIEMRNTIERMLNLYPDKISGWQGWLSNLERLYIDLLWAAATRDETRYAKTKRDLIETRKLFLEEVSKRGGANNPWVLSVLLCREEWQAEELWANGRMAK